MFCKSKSQNAQLNNSRLADAGSLFRRQNAFWLQGIKWLIKLCDLLSGTLFADFVWVDDNPDLEPLMGAVCIPGGGGGIMTYAQLSKRSTDLSVLLSFRSCFLCVCSPSFIFC